MKYFQKIMRRDKERFTVPRSVQQTISIQRIWQDGLFLFRQPVFPDLAVFGYQLPFIRPGRKGTEIPYL